ncbi:MAG: SDR family oxidoreductase [Phormidesmis sp.]
MNKVAVITGASRGIGAATAQLMAERGFSVGVNYLSNEAAAAAVVRKIELAGGCAIAVRADITQEDQITRLFERVDQQLGRLSVLVNNAGVLEKQMRVDEMSAERLNRIFAANVTSYFLCAKAAVRRMSTKYGGGGGAIVNVSSVAARLGSAGEYVDYAALKGAVDTLTIGLSKEVATEGIRVNAVRPGFIYTDIHATGGEPDRVDRVKQAVPMKRGGHPDEVAGAIAWLASEEAAYVTGTFIDVAGGR